MIPLPAVLHVHGAEADPYVDLRTLGDVEDAVFREVQKAVYDDDDVEWSNSPHTYSGQSERDVVVDDQARFALATLEKGLIWRSPYGRLRLRMGKQSDYEQEVT